MHIEVHHQLRQIEAKQWNNLIENDNPFLRHEFLNGLEVCGCVSRELGWQPHHMAIYNEDRNSLLAAMPCYVK